MAGRWVDPMQFLSEDDRQAVKSIRESQLKTQQLRRDTGLKLPMRLMPVRLSERLQEAHLRAARAAGYSV